MKLSLFTIVIASFVFSCKVQNGAGEEISTSVDRDRVANQVDSLQLDTSTFITTNFPDIGHRDLYIEIGTLWSYVDISVKNGDKKNNKISLNNLQQLLMNVGITMDSSRTGNFASKIDLNKRHAVEWHSGYSDTITTQVQYWYKGCKYILINSRRY